MNQPETILGYPDETGGYWALRQEMTAFDVSHYHFWFWPDGRQGRSDVFSRCGKQTMIEYLSRCANDYVAMGPIVDDLTWQTFVSLAILKLVFEESENDTNT